MNDKKELYHEIYQFFCKHTYWDWDEELFALFQCSVSLKDDEFTIKVYWKIVDATYKTLNTWVLKEITENLPGCRKTLKRLNLMNQTLSLIEEIKKKPKVTKYRSPRRSRYDYCLCCHKYVVKPEEIDKALDEGTEASFHSLIDRVLKEKDFYKRWFLVDRIMYRMRQQNPDVGIFLDLWHKIEKAGIHFNPLGFDFPVMTYFDPRYKNIFLVIFNYTHKEHDTLIDDICDHLIMEGRYVEVLDWLKKLSSPTRVLWSVHMSLMNKPEISTECLSFLRTVHQIYGARLRPSS
jgi:hypothetical protein